MMAAIVAAGFTACSDETTPIIDEEGNGIEQPGVESGEGTAATFTFKEGLSSKALVNDATEGDASIDSFRVVIYKRPNAGVISSSATPEIDTLVMGNGAATIFMTSGLKKIFVVANPNSQIDASGKKSFLTYGDFTKNMVDVTLKLDDIKHVLNNGAPNGGKFLLSNGLDACDYKLDPGVSVPESQTAGNNNNIEISVKRALAKLIITQTSYATPKETEDKKGFVSAAEWRMWNLNKDIFTTQNFANGKVFSPHADALATTFPTFFGRKVGLTAADNFITVINSTGVQPALKSGYYYITENVPATAKEGNATFAAIRATFKPADGEFIKTVDAFNNATSAFGMTTGAGFTAGNTFWRLDSIALDANGSLFQNLEQGLIFSDIKEVKRLLYHFVYKTHATLATDIEVTAADAAISAELDKFFTTYASGVCFYRLNIGEGTTGNIKYGVERNSYYWANIDGYAGLGVNTEDKLIEDEDKDLEGTTNLTVTIKVLPWNPVSSDQIIG